MKKKEQILLKIIAIFLGVFCLIFLIHKDETEFQLKQPVGEQINTESVYYLTEAILNYQKVWDNDLTVQKRNQLGEMKDRWTTDNLSFDGYIEIAKLLDVTKPEEYLPKNTYKEGFFLLKEDWYNFYKNVVSLYQLEKVIQEEEIDIIADDINLQAQKVGEKCVLTDTGERYQYLQTEVLQYKFHKITTYTAENTILSVVKGEAEKFELNNVWVMEKNDSGLLFLYKNYEILFQYSERSKMEDVVRESVADLTFREGILIETKTKQDRVNGKILRLTEDEIEIEDHGNYKFAEDVKVYRLYEQLQEVTLEEIMIGYDFTDFVLEDGKICAALIIRKENMENIRVAIRNSGFGSLYHDEIRVRGNCDIEIYYGGYEDRKKDVIKQGDEICITKGSNYLEGDRVILRPVIKSGKIDVLSIERSQGIPSYRGNMEITESEDGFILVNELLLEEYLYSVVPSEMPASYPMEALKAQAICARTYAYQYLTMPGLSSLGANVDDSVGYQVYNNITENSNSTKAVKETTGQILFYGDEIVNTYYYSTSCGFGTDAGVWQESNKEKFPYLMARNIAKNDIDITAEKELGYDMQAESGMRQYLNEINDMDYESAEPWYRWRYEVEVADITYLYERMKERYMADESKVLTFVESSEEYESITPEPFDEIYEIEVVKRREGGVIDELLINTGSGKYKIISEYNVRYILNQGGEVIRQDDSNVQNGQLLPSAYLVIDLIKEDGKVEGYQILGGGYGHGVGMSQNGAKAMAAKGMDSGEIICFFYPSCELSEVY